MANKLTHFAIHAEDVQRARDFYSSVFAWDFKEYGGAPGFCQIVPRGEAHPIGAIQSRRYNVLPDPLHGFECSISVDDLEATERAVESAGGVIVMKKTAIPHVGWVSKFRDPEGNVVDAVMYDPAAR